MRNVLNARVKGSFNVGSVARLHLVVGLERLPLALAKMLHPSKSVLAAQYFVEGGLESGLGVGPPVAYGPLGHHAKRHEPGVALLGN